jgi:hypothetical protein
MFMHERYLRADTIGEAHRTDHIDRRVKDFACATVIALCLTAGAAQASGHLPGMPVPPRDFADFAACKAHLQELHRIDLATATDKPEEIRPGATRQMLVDTDGVVEAGPEQATYSSRVGAQIRSRDEERGYIQTNYSYNEKQYACKGRTLSGTDGGGGYYLPGYEKIETTTSP